MNLEKDSAPMRMMGLATGLTFGYLLQKGQLNRRDVILHQLLLKDNRVFKTMGSAVLVGGLGRNILHKKGYIQKTIKPMNVPQILLGAIAFGVGLAAYGYCPGTSIAALGERRKDAVAGVLGMLAGAATFIALSPKLKKFQSPLSDLGKVTLGNIPDLWKRPEIRVRSQFLA